MNGAIIKLYVGKSERDLSDRVERLRFEHTIKKDNLVTIDIKAGYAFELADDADLVMDTVVKFQFGWAGGQLSKIHLAKISDVDVDYGSRIKLTVKALDAGNSMKKDSTLLQWKDKTASDIAKDVAKKFGLKAEVDTTTKKYNSVSSGGKNYYDFLTELAEIQENGSYIFYVSGDTLYFKKQDFKQAAKAKYTYGENIITFKPKLSAAKQSGASSEAEVKGVNPFDLTTIKETVTPSTVKENAALGKEGVETVVRDYNGDKIATKMVYPAAGDGSDAKNKASKKVKDANKKVLTATLEVDGVPTIMSDEILTVAGVARRHEGNWYIEKAVHDIAAGGAYKSTFDLTKNGTNKATKKGAGTNNDVNKTEGEKNPKGKVTVVRRDVNGEIQ